MCHEYLMSFKAGNPTKDFWRRNAPTVGPGIKFTGAQMRLQHAKRLRFCSQNLNALSIEDSNCC